MAFLLVSYERPGRLVEEGFEVDVRNPSSGRTSNERAQGTETCVSFVSKEVQKEVKRKTRTFVSFSIVSRGRKEQEHLLDPNELVHRRLGGIGTAPHRIEVGFRCQGNRWEWTEGDGGQAMDRGTGREEDRERESDLGHGEVDGQGKRGRGTEGERKRERQRKRLR